MGCRGFVIDSLHSRNPTNLFIDEIQNVAAQPQRLRVGTPLIAHGVEPRAILIRRGKIRIVCQITMNCVFVVRVRRSSIDGYLPFAVCLIIQIVLPYKERRDAVAEFDALKAQNSRGNLREKSVSPMQAKV